MKNLFKFLLLFLWRIIAILTICEVGLRLYGYILIYKQDLINKKSIANSTYRIMTLGESTTYGGGGENAWPRQLEHILNSTYPKFKFSIVNAAVPGVKTSEILSNMESKLNTYKPNMVISMIGINDDSSGINPTEGYVIENADSNKNFLTTFIQELKIYKVTKYFDLVITNYIEKFKKQVAQDKINQDDTNLSDTYYLDKGKLYFKQAKIQLAANMFLHATQVNPLNDQAFMNLARCYAFLKADPAEAINAYKQAIYLNPQNSLAYILLGEFYRDLKKYHESESIFLKITEFDPENDWALFDLAQLYHRNVNNYVKAEFYYKKYNSLYANNTKGFLGLSQLYRKTGRINEAEQIEKELNAKNSSMYLETARNYKKINEILKKARIKLVAMQYPLRDINLLKQMLDYDPEVLFVENESNFKKALIDKNYSDLFKDSFGGNFGHTTPYGHKLIAQNVADTILSYLFPKHLDFQGSGKLLQSSDN
ncbi:tetratricopeptide repeat protein [Candidatus Gottesmanbacteria bacterium]|nr:tetratricopeptide repeat protein [Candidatus Gottesmanbacteria bacterium]